MIIHLASDDPRTLEQQMRVWREGLLIRSDWAMLPDAPTDKEAWAAYRQALRDFPATWVASDTVEFPDPPGGAN